MDQCCHGLTVDEMINLINKVKELLGLEDTLAAVIDTQHRIEQKLDDALAGRLTPEQASQLEELKSKIESNDSKIGDMQK